MDDTNENVGVTPASPASRMISEEAAAKRLGKGRQWLRNQRLDGIGPKYIDLGNSVAYFPEDVDAWLMSRRREPEKVQRKRASTKSTPKSGTKPAPKPAAKSAPKSGTNQ